MILFSTRGKKVLHVFLSWYLWVEITLNEFIVEEDYVLIQNNIRDENIILFDDLNTEFSKLKLTKSYSAKSNTVYHKKLFSKKSFEEMIKAAMTRKYKTLKKRKININIIDINDDFLKSTVKNHV